MSLNENNVKIKRISNKSKDLATRYMQDIFARARTRPSARNDRVSCIKCYTLPIPFREARAPVVYNIPYCRASAWPGGFWPSARERAKVSYIQALRPTGRALKGNATYVM